LPPQILLVPVSKLTELLGIYDTLPALIVVQIGFGLGFLHVRTAGFMGIPAEISRPPSSTAPTRGRCSPASSCR